MIDFIQSLRNPMVYLMWTLGLAYVTWFLYIGIMHLVHVRKRLHRVAYALALPWVALGLLLDALLNIAVTPYLGLPRELLLTARLKRHKREGGYRARAAYWICEHLLNQFDEGHC